MTDTTTNAAEKGVAAAITETIRRLGFERAVPDLSALAPAPIEPGWIVDGAPVARAVELSRSADGGMSTMMWDCTAGTFRWHFTWEETVHILEGEVEVTCVSGETRVFRAGDVGYFPGGSWALWHVPVYVRKIAFCRQPTPKLATQALRLFASALKFATRSGGTRLKKPGARAA